MIHALFMLQSNLPPATGIAPNENNINYIVLFVLCQYKEYISEEEATSALYEQETWSQYKTALWKRMIAPYPAAR